MADVSDFLSSLLGREQNGGSTNSNGSGGKLNRIAIIDSGYTGIGNPAVIFEGETTSSSPVTYSVIGEYSPYAGDRVIMMPVGTTYIIMGKITGPPAAQSVGGWTYVGSKKGPAFQNGWSQFPGMDFAPPRFMVDAKGKVRIQGLVQSGTIGAGHPIFALPANLWPDSNLTFIATVNGAYGGQIRIDTVGNVTLFYAGSGGDSGFVSLDNIAFFPASLSAKLPWRKITTFSSGWSNIGGVYSPARIYVDPDGIVHTTGLISGGSFGTVFALNPSELPVGGGAFAFAMEAGNGGIARVDIDPFGQRINVSTYNTDNTPGDNTLVSLDGIEYVGASSKLPVLKTNFVHHQNGWDDLIGIWDGFSYVKDTANIVHVSDLLTNGAFNSIIDLLPPTHRPGHRLLFAAVAGANQGARVDVGSDGNIIATGTSANGTNNYLTLNNIHFLAE